VIELGEVTKRYGAKTAVDRLTLTIPDRAVTVLLGPSGCGKTTTLKMINRLIEPTSGDIRIDGRSIATMDPIALRRSIGYVIQETGLFPHYTVEGNIGVVPRLSWMGQEAYPGKGGGVAGARESEGNRVSGQVPE